jgi:hypothetical protein
LGKDLGVPATPSCTPSIICRLRDTWSLSLNGDPCVCFQSRRCGNLPALSAPTPGQTEADNQGRSALPKRAAIECNAGVHQALSRAAC